MDATAILDRLRALGVHVEAADDKLALSPASIIPPELLALVREHKPAILAALAPEPPVDALFRRCGELGVTLRLVDTAGAWGLVASPRSSVTPELAEAISRHKAVLLAELIRTQVCSFPGCRQETFVYARSAGDLPLQPLCREHSKPSPALPGSACFICDRPAAVLGVDGLARCDGCNWWR